MNKEKILIVKDEWVVDEDLRKIVETKAFEVVGIVNSGKIAIDAVRRLKPDLVLMDCNLSGSMNGFTVAEILWGEIGIPVILFVPDPSDNIAKVMRYFGPYCLQEIVRTYPSY